MKATKERTKRERIGERVTIYTRGKNKTYVADFWFEGSHRRKSLGTTNLRIARRRAVKLDRQLALGEFETEDHAHETKVPDAVGEFLSYLEFEGCRPKTIVRYRGELNAFAAFLSTNNIEVLSNIGLRHFDRFRVHRADGRCASTLNHEAAVCKQWMAWCKSRGFISENPLADLIIKKLPPIKMPVPTMAEVVAIIRACSPINQQKLAILAMTGLRIGELRGLLKSNVDLRQGIIRVVGQIDGPTKTKGTRDIPIHPNLKPILAELIKADDHDLFVTALPSPRYPAGGRPISDKRLNTAIRRATAGVSDEHYTNHSLRRFFNTFCINQGVPERVVRLWMGHSDRSMTGIYYGLNVDESIRFMQKVDFGDIGKS